MREALLPARTCSGSYQGKMDGAAAFRIPWMRIILIFGVQITLSVSQGPYDDVANPGETITFTFTSDNPGYYNWGRYDPTPMIIYANGDPQTTDPSKYSVNNGTGTFNLTVINVAKQDASTYCFFSQTTKLFSCANLIVIDELIPSVNPPNGVAVGQMVNLTCLLEYGGPTTDASTLRPLAPGQDPQLSMFIGSTEITGLGQQVIGADQRTHSKSLSVNRTIMASDANQYLICKVMTTSPAYNSSSSTYLNVRSATTSAHIQYINATMNGSSTCCKVNDILNCTANGYSFPTITWTTNTGLTLQPFSSGNGFSAVRITTLGSYTVNCSARNDMSSMLYNDTITVNAAVVQNGTGESQEQEKDRVGLGVGIGVGIGVPVLIGVIALIVILSRRKKNAKPIAVKQPETKSKVGQTGKAPINNGNGKGPDPGPRNNVNPNPNPTYYTPVMPEQTGNVAPKNVRDSPGYGDLGVRHIGGSGSNPHLNESFDSQADKSFNSSSNRPSGDNLQFVGGKTNHSPSAPNTSV